MAHRRWIPDSPLGWAVRGLLLVAFVCFAWVGWVMAETARVNAWQERELAAVTQSLAESSAASDAGSETDAAVASLAEKATPEWGVLEEGDLVGRIDLERLDISAVMLHGMSSGTLRRAVGLLPGTARPGEPGNVGLAGHRDSFFRELGDTRRGDRIVLTTPHGHFHYEVESTRVVSPQDTHVLDQPMEGEELTLVTCYPFYFVGPAPDRFVVHAKRVDPPR